MSSDVEYGKRGTIQSTCECGKRGTYPVPIGGGWLMACENCIVESILDPEQEITFDLVCAWHYQAIGNTVPESQRSGVRYRVRVAQGGAR